MDNKTTKIFILIGVFVLLLIPVSASSLEDSDNDLYTDEFEILLGTDPQNPESKPECCGGSGNDNNENGIPDYIEALMEINPLTGMFVADSANVELDTDGDGLSDLKEYYYYGTSPTEVDTDGDGISDFDEVKENCCTDKEADNDGDGCTNIEEFDRGTNLDDPSDCGTGIEGQLVKDDITIQLNNLTIGALIFAILIVSAVAYYFVSNKIRRI